MRNARSIAAVSLVALLSVSSLFSMSSHSSHPNVARGYLPGKMFVFEKPDSINLFNGALAVTVPLGGKYPLSENLSYGFSLTYSSHVWDMVIEDEPPTDDPPGGQDSFPQRLTIPSILSNAGMGWMISFGILLPPGSPTVNPGVNWVFITQDGAQHEFYRTLHHGDYPAGQEPQDVFYTRDGSYLRLVKDDEDTYIVQSPDGIEYLIEQTNHTSIYGMLRDMWRVVRIRDTFGNYLSILYEFGISGCDPVVGPDCERWTVTDIIGRTHTLEFERVEQAVGHGDPSHRTHLKKISLESFNGQLAEYTFDYQDSVIPYSSKDTYHRIFVTLPTTEVDLLSTIHLPDEALVQGELLHSTYTMVYNLDDCSNQCEPGTLARLMQPTGGINTYTYGEYDMPGENKLCGANFPENEYYRDRYNGSISRTRGVVMRSLQNVPDGDDEFWWKYEPQDSWLPGQQDVWRKVTSPDGNDTVHYFNANANRCFSASTEWDGWGLGLAFTPDPGQSFAGVKLARKYYQGSSDDPDNLRKVEYTNYTRDELAPIVSNPSTIEEALIRVNPTWWYNTNRRPLKMITKYFDDSAVHTHNTTTTFSDFDGLGHQRAAIMDADLGSGFCDSGDCITDEETATEFNPSSGTYAIHNYTNNPLPEHDYVPWSVFDPWILGNSTESVKTITYANLNTDTATIETEFDPDTGLLRRKRVYANGTSRGIHDLITAHTYNVQGNLALTTTHGADRQEVSTGDLSSIPLPVPDAAVQHEYEHGVRARTWIVPIGDPRAPDAPLTLDRNIDQSTGLPITERDVSGYENEKTYDLLGRLTEVTPDDDDSDSARFVLEYDPAKITGNLTLVNDPTIDLRAQVTLSSFAQAKDGDPVAKTTEEDPYRSALSVSFVLFDGFGHTAVERIRLPDDVDPVWPRRLSVHDGRGRLLKQSEWIPADHSTANPVWTEYLNHDFEGRVGSIVKPDTATTDFEYDGIQKVTRIQRDVSVADDGPTFPPTTTDIEVVTTRDGFGRTRTVVEQVNATATVTTTSAFDVLGNLTEVRIKPSDAPTQARGFEYDHLGFLREKVVPEKTRTLNATYWDVKYDHYNTLGQAAVVQDVDRHFLHIHDAFNRLVEVWERAGGAPSADRRLLRSFDYYDSTEVNHGYNPVPGWALHRLEKATNWNYHSVSNWHERIQIANTYTYAGTGGAMDTRLTEGGGETIAEAFETSFAYTPLGLTETIEYPVATYPPLTGDDWYGLTAPNRTVEYTYEFGWLTRVRDITGVLDLASDIEYYPSGMIKSFTGGDGSVEQRTTINENTYLPRPVTIETSQVSPFEPIWSANYEYDTAGNISQHGPLGYESVNIYDRLGRLVQAVTPGVRSELLYYDGFGNITKRWEYGGTFNVEYEFEVDEETNRITSDGILYDDSGNLTYLGPEVPINLRHTAFNQAIRVESTNKQYNLYDADGERAVEAPDGGDYTYILRDHEGKPLRRVGLRAAYPFWFWDRDYIRMPGHLLAAFVHNPEGPGAGEAAVINKRFFYADHLGTPRLITSDNGVVVAEHQYLPFGTQISNTGQDSENLDEPMKFTGQKRDYFDLPGTKWDLDDFHARIHSPYLGRFLSVDPVESGRIGGSQSWNRYSYVMNNPLTYVDPDGRTERKGWRAGTVRNNSSRPIWIAADKDGRVTVVLLKPGEGSTTHFVDTDAVVIDPDAPLDGKTGAYKIGTQDIDIEESESGELVLDLDNAEFLINKAMKTEGFLTPEEAEKQGWVIPTEPDSADEPGEDQGVPTPEEEEQDG